jgi:5'-3' exonuclease
MTKRLIIDANAVGYYHQQSGIRLSSGEQDTHAVFGFIKDMRKLRVGWSPYELMVLWDGRADWRFDLLPTYKSNRSSDAKRIAMRESYHSQRPYIAKMLEALGIVQVTANQHEADDMAGYVVAAAQPTDDIILYTADKDWLQLLGPNVRWMDTRGDNKIVCEKDLMDLTGYKTPMAFLQGKALTGDSSDTIPGVGGIGETRAPVFLAEFGSVKEFWRRCDAGWVPKEKYLRDFAQPPGRAAFKRNVALMQLLRVAKPDRGDVDFVRGRFDQQRFEELCIELNFASILSDLDNFLRPFKEVKRSG